MQREYIYIGAQVVLSCAGLLFVASLLDLKEVTSDNEVIQLRASPAELLNRAPTPF